MAVPDTLIITDSAPLWDSSSGWQTVVTYEGTCTESELSSAVETWQASGATRIAPVKKPYQFAAGGEYSYEVTATVTFAATSSEGTPPNPADPDYGLFSRTWTLDYEDDQVPLIAGLRATELYDFDADWPTRIQVTASRFRSAWSAYIAAEAGAAGTGTRPNRALDWLPLVQVAGSGTAPSGLLRNAIAVWLFNRMAADEDATDRIKRPVLRKVESVASVSNVRASNTDAERVLRYATLTNREATLAAAILLNLAQVKTLFPYWLKSRPVIETAQQGRFNITQDYTGLAAYDGIQWGGAV